MHEASGGEQARDLTDHINFLGLSFLEDKKNNRYNYKVVAKIFINYA